VKGREEVTGYLRQFHDDIFDIRKIKLKHFGQTRRTPIYCVGNVTDAYEI
jgi:hypothetical protein